MIRLARRAFLLTGTLGLPMAAATSVLKSGTAHAASDRLVIEIGVNGKTFVFTDNGDGATHGAPFIVMGPIFAEGTFEQAGENNGLLEDGSPAIPEAVIGNWLCKGWFIHEGLAAKTGPDVATTQVYDFSPDEPGRDTLVSDGIELADTNVPFSRAVVGGSGKYKMMQGEVTQTKIGTNATGAPSFVFEFDIRERPAAGYSGPGVSIACASAGPCENGPAARCGPARKATGLVSLHGRRSLVVEVGAVVAQQHVDCRDHQDG